MRPLEILLLCSILFSSCLLFLFSFFRKIHLAKKTNILLLSTISSLFFIIIIINVDLQEADVFIYFVFIIYIIIINNYLYFNTINNLIPYYYNYYYLYKKKCSLSNIWKKFNYAFTILKGGKQNYYLYIIYGIYSGRFWSASYSVISNYT